MHAVGRRTGIHQLGSLLIPALLGMGGGCQSLVRPQVFIPAPALTAKPIDQAPAPVAPALASPGAAANPTVTAGSEPLVEQTAAQQKAASAESASSRIDTEIWRSAVVRAEGTGDPGTAVQAARPSAASQKPAEGFEERLRLPKGLPGAEAELKLPPRTASEAERKKAIAALYPPLPPLPPGPQPQPGPNGHPYTLAELQQLALANSPSLRQATADVEAARGAARQAGAYPNPNFGYESDTAGQGGTAGVQGFFFEQLIKTAGKLKTAEASALMNWLNAQLALRRAQTDLEMQVRAGYFAVLVARQSMLWNEQLVEFTERVYRLFYDQLLGGQLAGYEPAQLRAVTIQARGSLIQARERYRSAWAQLAATLGMPDLPLTELDGSAEMPPPEYSYREALARVLGAHTDLLTARNSLQRARYDLRTAEITPIPDVDVRVAIQKDYTTPPFGITHSVQVGVPIPVWDRNRGGVRQAQANLLRATEEERRVRSDLSTRLADAFERYEANRRLAQNYRERVLPDLGLVYGRAVARFGSMPVNADASLVSLDVVTHQGNYLSAIATYEGILRDQWQAVADLSGLLQIDDLNLGLEQAPAGGAWDIPPELGGFTSPLLKHCPARIETQGR